MSSKGQISNNIFHFLKERKNMVEESALPTHEINHPEIWIEIAESLFWGFVPSHGTRQDEIFLITEEERASSTPGCLYNPVSEKFLIQGPVMNELWRNIPEGKRRYNVEQQTNHI
jgi:hypothetical protein